MLPDQQKLANELEQKIKEAIDNFKPIQKLPELEYLNIVDDALDMVSEGITMRIAELKGEEE